MELSQLGNIYSSDGDFTTKAAIQQSAYRVSINEKCGTGKKNITIGFGADGKPILKSIEQEYGHLVTEGKLRNKNFFYEETFEYAKHRVYNKKKDETIKADRLFNNLLSSMPMAFNLFHPLMMIREKHPDALNKMIRNAFHWLPISEVKQILIEFIPDQISLYTGDRSAMDAAILFSNSSGENFIISIETKYIDRLGKNLPHENRLHINTAKRLNFFSLKGVETIQKSCTQIYRNFLLTEKYRIVNGLSDSYSIIMSPAEHPTTDIEIRGLHENLKPEYHYKLRKYTLEDFAKALKSDCPMDFLPWLSWFRERYLDFEKTEYLFKQFKGK